MIVFLKRLLGIRPRPRPQLALVPDYEGDRMAVIRKAFETGKPVFGNYDEHGNFTMEVLEEKE